MRIIFVAGALAFVVSSLVACAGVKTRTPDEWKTEIGHGLAAHAGDLKACYDNSGLKTKVSIGLRLIADKHQDSSGGSNPGRRRERRHGRCPVRAGRLCEGGGELDCDTTGG